MKLKILLMALFLAGVGASLALAAPRAHGTGTTTGTTAAGTTTTGKHHGESGSGCRNVELKGTIANGTLSLAVTGPPGRRDGHKTTKGPVGQTVSLSVSGKASVQARVCGASGSQTYQLRVLKVDEHQAPGVTVSTGTTTTP